MTYWGHRNSITTAQANNAANEYTSVEDVRGGGGATTVYYGAADTYVCLATAKLADVLAVLRP